MHTNSQHDYCFGMRSHTTTLFAALALAPTCAECLKIPNEHPGISSTKHGSIAGGGGEGGNDGGTVLVTRQLLRGQPSKAQHSAQAMFTVMASFAFVGTAVAAVVSGGDVGDSGGGGGEGGSCGMLGRREK
jgi:hypothetical protein